MIIEAAAAAKAYALSRANNAADIDESTEKPLLCADGIVTIVAAGVACSTATNEVVSAVPLLEATASVAADCDRLTTLLKSPHSSSSKKDGHKARTPQVC